MFLILLTFACYIFLYYWITILWLYDLDFDLVYSILKDYNYMLDLKSFCIGKIVKN